MSKSNIIINAYFRAFFDDILNFLVEHEENGDIVEMSYSILERFIKVSEGKGTHQNIRIMEQSKNLLSIGIKHTAVFQCEQAYTMLKALTTISDKYKSKSEIE